MKTVRVATDPPYEVRVGRGLLAELAAETARFPRRGLLTDERVGALYLERLSGIDAPSLAVPAGEASKSLATLERVLDFMAGAGLERSSCLLALGGGVVGDLAGLAASLYMRGIAVVQVPTTLLAQVDASVGGKTAVNLAAGKNLAGTFHQPALVVCDVETLATLEREDFESGLGEVVKSAILEGEDALRHLERARARIRARDPDALAEIVERCVRLKASIVVRDPKEEGARRALNLGHTFAHAIEKAAGYGRVPHGSAVAVGLTLALRASSDIGLLEDAGLVDRVRQLLLDLAVPADLGSLRERYGVELFPAAIVAGMSHDKKNVGGTLRLVLPVRAGRVELGVELDGPDLARSLASA